MFKFIYKSLFQFVLYTVHGWITKNNNRSKTYLNYNLPRVYISCSECLHSEFFRGSPSMDSVNTTVERQ